jgi:hypothetical protein
LPAVLGRPIGASAWGRRCESAPAHIHRGTRTVSCNRLAIRSTPSRYSISLLWVAGLKPHFHSDFLAKIKSSKSRGHGPKDSSACSRIIWAIWAVVFTSSLMDKAEATAVPISGLKHAWRFSGFSPRNLGRRTFGGPFFWTLGPKPPRPPFSSPQPPRVSGYPLPVTLPVRSAPGTSS